ncbi:MurR/RpiR family transcriptional regulator [Alcaligenes faecalis]|uniref:MurR/RpiR family transcriptional regulator n=1 Tax=Alcaligenes faecalis TaxID=511 RepID=UPI0024BD3C5B|nr:hypothetical protein [Alcaligenes faecalis]
MEPLLRLQRILPGLTPELRRAAQWVERHPVEVSLWSMRKQAQELSVAPATMLRLAKAAGYESYDCFREPFQQALHRNGGTMAARAQNLQGNRASEQQTRDLGSNRRWPWSLSCGSIRSALWTLVPRRFWVLQSGFHGFGSELCLCVPDALCVSIDAR